MSVYSSRVDLNNEHDSLIEHLLSSIAAAKLMNKKDPNRAKRKKSKGGKGETRPIIPVWAFNSGTNIGPPPSPKGDD